ncbi:hypothetical protein ES703_31954 [subsurface metagenome]
MSEEGKCPKCGSLEVDYGAVVGDRSGDVYYPFTCYACGFKGQAWYHLDFDTMTDDEGEEV